MSARDRDVARVDALRAERGELLERVDRLEAERRHLIAVLTGLQTERDGLKGKVEGLEAELGQMADRLRQVERDYLSIKGISEEYKEALKKVRHSLVLGRLPPMLITTMPKSGTYYLSKLFVEGLFIESRIVSHQYFPYDVIRQPELRALSHGNAVSQDHFGASKINLVHIAKHVDRMIVHVRDPQQAMLSYVHFLGTEQFRRNEAETLMFIYPPLPDDFYRRELEAKLDWAIDNWLPLLVEWTEEWVAAAASLDRPAIKFTRYEDLVADRDEFVRQTLDFFGIPAERFIQPRIEADDEIHFRKGEVDEWLSVFTPAQVLAADARIPPALAARFGWVLGGDSAKRADGSLRRMTRS